MNDIGFLITTCNREESCQRLVDDLQDLGTIYVLNDGGNYSIRGAINYHNPTRLGKYGYWKTVNTLFKIRGDHKYYFMIPDDFYPVPGMVETAITTWESINDKHKICLSLGETRTDSTCWTRFKAVDKGGAWLTQWVDMCFLCENEFFLTVGTIPPLFGKRINVKTKGGSKVGSYISKLLYKLKYNMYQVKDSLFVINFEHDKTQMHDGYVNTLWNNVVPPKVHHLKKIMKSTKEWKR